MWSGCSERIAIFNHLMISSEIMQKGFPNIIVLLSILAFLVTSAGNTFGFAWCVGDDGRTRVEQASVNGCADRQGECHPLDSYAPISISGLDSEHSSSCSDVLIGSDEVVISKRIVKPHKLSLVDNVEVFPLKASDNQPRQLLAVTPPQRVSQAILAHRTVVLLN
jgi:hypothetical protein